MRQYNQFQKVLMLMVCTELDVFEARARAAITPVPLWWQILCPAGIGVVAYLIALASFGVYP